MYNPTPLLPEGTCVGMSDTQKGQSSSQGLGWCLSEPSASGVHVLVVQSEQTPTVQPINTQE